MIELARARDITALFRDSLAVYGRHAHVFIALSAAVVVPVLLAVEGIGLEKLTASYDDSPTVAEAAVPTVVSFLVVTPIITAICIHALRSVAAGEQRGRWAGVRLRLRGVHAAVLRRADRRRRASRSASWH